MARIERIEDLLGWQRARELARGIYRVSSNGAFARDYALRDQIRRATISILSNVAEGFERGGDSEFVQFLAVAKASAGEVRAQLYVALDQGYLSETQFQELLQKTTEVSKLIAGLITYLQTSGLKGSKYRPRS
jgi:four helix bundle protein